MSNHPIVHVEIPSEDTATSSKFYADLFGWTDHYAPEFDYHMFQTEPDKGGGFVKIGNNQQDNRPYKAGEVLIYFATDDIDATLAKAESLGGKTLIARTEIPTAGWFAFFADPAGNRIGLFTGMATQS